MSQDSTIQTRADELGPANSEVVARAARYYRVTRYIMVAVLIGYGLWSIYDGFINWPRQNQEFVKANPAQKPPHTDTDILFNKVLGIALPPAGVLLLVMAMRKSRGEIRLSNETLHAPGHPSVPFDAITALDKRLWEKKGIAYVRYSLSERGGSIVLDDFIYEREPIDKIYKAVENYVAPAGADAAPGDPANEEAHD